MANLEYLRQLEANGYRQPGRQTKTSTAQKPTPQATHRGHKLKRLGSSRWKCVHCLSVRTSLRAHRWPLQCSGMFRANLAGDKAVHIQPVVDPAPLAGAPPNEAEAAGPGSGQPGSTGGQAYNPLDDPEPEDLLDEEPMLQPDHEEDLPPDMPPSPVQAPLPPPPPPTHPPSWWDRLGELIPASELRVGGASLHHSHWLAHFGNAQHRLVMCAQCGGTTTGAFSNLLADQCRRSAAPTRSRHLRRMLLQGQWPLPGASSGLGRGEASGTIRLVPVGPLLRIAAAANPVRAAGQRSQLPSAMSAER